MLETNPNDRKLLLSAAEAYTTYAALIENDDLPRARRLYRRAKEYGIRALPPQQAQVLQAPYAKFAAAIEEFNDSDLPAVFWTASSWGAWISISTESMATLAELPKVIALMHWVLARDDSYQNGSPHVFLGVYHSALPPMLGGNPEKAAHHFDRALAISEGRQLIFYVLKAKFYARQTFDRPLYESLLNKVLTSPIDAAPDFALQNTAAQDQARILLGQTDDFF
ncbi:MAG: TRAP transporter TatT component family protein [Candidatus Latescibacterota bacterium]|nr:TRAP transporter TatT component family protein [Candidatus Latescibacterota bacterium]